MSAAGVFQLVHDLYASGAMCLCKNWITVPDGDDDSRDELIHEIDCTGRRKILELLGSDSED